MINTKEDILCKIVGGRNMSKINQIFDRLFAIKVPSDILLKSNYHVFQEMAESKELEGVRLPKDELRDLFGKKGKPFSEVIGTHPDFLNTEDLPKEQYICSVFLDISGSTRLGLKFPLPTVRFYKNAILRSAIEIFQAFDGHIHRLQGDAVFAYFGHKNMSKSNAIINALNAAAVMQSYNKHTLTKFFESNNLPPLKIRIGIDIGDDDQVLWSEYGVGGVTEITSTSIHTDLAAKLQSKAPKNSVLIGENIYRYLDLPEEFWKVKIKTEDGKKKEDKYIINDARLGAYYQMRLFDWEKYIQSFSFLPKESDLRYVAPDDFEIICRIRKQENGPIMDYKSNSEALEKGVSLGFKLQLKGALRVIKPSKITWKVINRGREAEEANALEFYMEEYQNKDTCYQSTAYTGHHYMECKLYDSQGRLIGQDRFGVYVNDEKREMKKLGVKEGVLTQ